MKVFMSGLIYRGVGLGVLAGALALAACGSKPLNRAPVEDRGVAGKPANVVMDARTQAVKQPPGFENAGKPGYYTVKPGDTLMRISLETSQSRKDITRWNTLENPDKIEIGQVLRVVPPLASEVAPVAVSKPVTSSAATVAPVAATPAKAASAPVEATPTAVAAPAAVAVASTDEFNLTWPASGAVVSKFDEARKGIDIGGEQGAPIYAAADGKIILAEMGQGIMSRYGNLIIIKHANFLTAYAHNNTMLVKEDQMVKKGQKIATMGSTGTDSVKLHFELRQREKVLDPSKYLPAK